MKDHQRFRFSLSFAFLVMTNACVVAWGIAAISSQDVAGLLVVPIFASLSGASYGVTRGRQPVIVGAVSGFAGMATLALSYCSLHGIGYFFYTGSEDYFEDGAFIELVVFPPVYVMAWGGLGALIGMLCGAMVLEAYNWFVE